MVCTAYPIVFPENIIMRNLYVCDNCLWNPAQYQDIGASIGFCLRYNSLLKNASHTTCRFFQRKDLPSFVAEDGHQEHAKAFAETHGIVFYSTAVAEQVTPYSHRHVWLTHTFDPYLHEVAMYHQMEKKWMYLETFPASRNPIKSIMYSSFVRRYIAQSGAQHDHYRMMLCLSADLNETIELQLRDFRIDLSSEEFEAVHETYLKDIVLLKIYAIQEYGNIVHDDDLMWDKYCNADTSRQPEAVWQFSRVRYQWAKEQWPNLSDHITTIWTLQDFGLIPTDIDLQTTVPVAGGNDSMLVNIPRKIK